MRFILVQREVGEESSKTLFSKATAVTEVRSEGKGEMKDHELFEKTSQV